MTNRMRTVLRLWLLGCATLAGCGEHYEPLTAGGTPIAPGPVTRDERVWTDASRPTARNGTYAGAADRTLRTLVWQPAGTQPQPLFVLAHGFGGLPEKFEGMARAIAAAGFVVAAPAFPLTNQNAPGGYLHALRDVANQPADVSFLITTLLEANAAAGDPLRGRISAGEIAVLGHSLGGTTTIALTRKACCRDRRVRAAILFAPGPIDVFANLFGADPIGAGPPTLVLQGTKDPIITYPVSERLYSQLGLPSCLVGITGADHSDAIEARSEPLTGLELVSERAIVAFLNAIFRNGGTEFDETLAGLAAEGHVAECKSAGTPIDWRTDTLAARGHGAAGDAALP